MTLFDKKITFCGSENQLPILVYFSELNQLYRIFTKKLRGASTGLFREINLVYDFIYITKKYISRKFCKKVKHLHSVEKSTKT